LCRKRVVPPSSNVSPTYATPEAKLRQAQAGSSITTDQTFWYNLDDALYALEETPARFAGAGELEQVRERIIHWQNELATANAAGCARTAA